MTNFINVFGGTPVQTSEVSYRQFILSIDVILSWPTINADTDNVVAKLMEVTSTDPANIITMPPANQTSVGQDTIIRNIGGIAFNVVDNLNGAIATIGPGQVFYIYVKDNTTAPGIWGSLQFGTGVSSADAASLAGFGLTAIASTLNTSITPLSFSLDYSVVVSDRAKLYVWEGGSGTVTFPNTSTFGPGYFVCFSNLGTGTLTLQPSFGQLIDGQANIILQPDESAIIATDGSEWRSLGRTRSPIFNVSQLNKNVAGNVNVTLSNIEASNIIQRYFGLLTGSISVIFPSAVNFYIIYNNTTGTFGLTVRTATGTGLSIPQGQRTIVYCDGNDIVPANTILPVMNIQFGDGSAATPSIAFATNPSDGFYHPSINNIGVSLGGVQKMLWDATNATFNENVVINPGNLTLSNGNISVTAATGSISAPSILENGIDIIALILQL